MVIKPEEMKVDLIENMRGGKGKVEIQHLVDKQLLEGKARLFAKLTVKPNSSVGFHKHENEFEIFYILSGKGLFHEDDKTIPIQAGDVCLTQSGHSHSIENTSETEDLVFLAVIFLL
ncbi:cupin domain-containing protein [Pseudothermotoga thermarum]|uniref:Cupin 2 conserved barrel domain protein n=1 Tax=Pseudothermotoga thermarum DSM 5069 TaxID=688269 RepID=F7YWC1_9THEM|nr:cupin domain-containing protein [Pseudothermotoga thermarum]AEH51899.1 Cupin 2 conserved barrel domain protein [Pseudothermotoga thermarum DSM 5069]